MTAGVIVLPLPSLLPLSGVPAASCCVISPTYTTKSRSDREREGFIEPVVATSEEIEQDSVSQLVQ